VPPSIFIETTIPSYYVSRPSRNLLQLARQELTKQWWDGPRSKFVCFTSQLVLDEAGAGEPVKAAERLHLLSGLQLLDLNDEVDALARELIGSGTLPATAIRDASHLAAAGAYGMDFLLRKR